MMPQCRFHRKWRILLISVICLAVTSCHLKLKTHAAGMSLKKDSFNNEMAIPDESITDFGKTVETKALQEPLKITIEEAILFSLENNRTLVVERLHPAIRKTLEDQEQAVFDPQAGAEISFRRIRNQRFTSTREELDRNTASTTESGINLAQFFPTGTTIALEGDFGMEDFSSYQNRLYATRFGMTITQAILKGYGSEANLAALRQAALNTRVSEYELRGFIEFLVAQVEQTCWDYVLARRRIEIFEGSLNIARQQLHETKELITVGRLPEAELPAVQAEVASQEQALINARSGMESIRLQLLRLLNPPESGLRKREIYVIHQPLLPEIQLDDIEFHVAVSMRMRPELNQARLGVLHGNLELVKTRNGLLPLMDIFLNLGKSGYADSFGGSFRDLDENNYNALFGIQFQYPIFNRKAKALHRQALLSREQTENSLDNLSQIVELDVRTAYIEVNRTQQQIAASSATRMFNQEKLRIETEKFRVGRSTSFLVAQAQRDLLVSRITEVQAVADYLKALVNLYRMDGTLLERRGISAPGRESMENSIFLKRFESAQE